MAGIDVGVGDAGIGVEVDGTGVALDCSDTSVAAGVSVAASDTADCVAAVGVRVGSCASCVGDADAVAVWVGTICGVDVLPGTSVGCIAAVGLCSEATTASVAVGGIDSAVAVGS